VRIAAVLLAAAVAASADRVVERDGNILKGPAEMAEGVVRLGGKAIPLENVLLVERDDGTLLHAPDFEARMRGYEYLAMVHLRDEYTKLVRECCQVSDFVLARNMLEKAESAGLASREAIELKRKIEKDEKKRTEPGGVKSERLLKRAQEIDVHFPQLLAARAACEHKGGNDCTRLLREALRRGAPGEELLQQLAPKDFLVGDSRVWLNWHVDLELAGTRVVADDLAALQRARKTWRRDLHGLQADEILLLTPVKESYLIGRCLAHGRLACRALNDIFEAGAAPAGAEPLLIFLFGSREEYMTTSGTGRTHESPAFLEWTAGHYSPSEKVSRFFWVSDADGERNLVGTCVHELTHHWLDRRRPERAAPNAPGFWIVEGFATFMEEGVYDADAGVYSLYNPRSRSLDVVRAMPAKRLIPWNQLYALSQIDFAQLSHDDGGPVTLRWNLRQQLLPSSRLFYEQSAATCQYLFHAEDGKYRAQLLKYVDAYYDGKVADLDIARAFGVNPAVLGEQVQAFARKQ
jgi:hypothetical protein